MITHNELGAIAKPYGFLESATWNKINEVTVRIILTIPESVRLGSNREIRCEYYLQAESLIAVMESRYEFLHYPWITIDSSTDGLIGACVELYLIGR